MVESKDRQAAGTEQKPFCVVGIGASAGGLGALRKLFAHMPADSGLAFVIIVHLSPQHESHLAELLQPNCPIPVEQVTETVRLEPNRVFIIPPNANLNTIDTHLRLSDLEADRRDRAPIDHFFRTLAETHGEQAVGLVLTGTGSDGTLGLRHIKEHGGLTIAQDPQEAEYDGMPRSAVTSGVVDMVLPLAEVPDAVIHFARTKPRLALPGPGEESPDGERALQKVYAHVRAASGRDFSAYKRSTVMRRIRRRMQLHHVEELAAYVDILRRRREEAKLLADDLLITVTEFFRDVEAFEKLEKEVIPRLFDEKGPEDQVRIWSVGCSTGEEAYSLAMLLLEEAAGREQPPRIQVFASDLHEGGLKKAREGLYPESIQTHVAPERLQRFFTKEDSSFRIRRAVRELVTFAVHDLLRDPPLRPPGPDRLPEPPHLPAARRPAGPLRRVPLRPRARGLSDAGHLGDRGTVGAVLPGEQEAQPLPPPQRAGAGAAEVLSSPPLHRTRLRRDRFPASRAAGAVRRHPREDGGAVRAAEHPRQRAARDEREHERGAGHGQPGEPPPARGAQPAHRRPAEPAGGHADRHVVPGPRAADPPLHAPGDGAVQPAAERPGTAPDRPDPPAGPEHAPGRRAAGARAAGPRGAGAPQRGRALVPHPPEPLPHRRRPHRRRGGHLHRRHRPEALCRGPPRERTALPHPLRIDRRGVLHLRDAGRRAR